jgi:hypothetical protein
MLKQVAKKNNSFSYLIKICHTMKKNDDMKPININALSKWKKFSVRFMIISSILIFI